MARSKNRTAGAIDLPRVVVGVLMLAALLLALKWLQDRYDSSDHRKATTLVRTYRAKPEGPSIPDTILRRHPEVHDEDVSWSSEILSSCLGTVRVFAYIPKKGDSPSATYGFDVRLTDGSIHPTDPTTIEILKALTATASKDARVHTTTTAMRAEP